MNDKNETVAFEIRCRNCDYVELWGLERAIRELIRARKLSVKTDFDAILIQELFRVNCRSVPCPKCRSLATLTAEVPKKNQWTWADEVRCEDCGQEIPAARVAAVPGVSRCVSCQQVFEKH